MENKKLSEFTHSSLVTASQIAFIEKSDKTREFLKYLDDVLQFLIKDQKTVPLYDELQILEKYIFIQNTRYGNRYRLDVTNEESNKNVFITRSTIIGSLDTLLGNLLDRHEGCIRINLDFDKNKTNRFTINIYSSENKESFTYSLF